MSEWHPQIVKIEKVEKHPNADNLDIVTVLNDYPVVTKHNEYNVGDLSVYIPIDSIVPDNELFYFLCPKVYEKYEDENGQIQQRQIGLKYPVGSVPEKYRIIKAKKLRGIYSQGILVKITDVIKDENTISSLKVGDSVVDLLGLRKWEEPEDIALIRYHVGKTKGANAEKAPSGWSIPYYDIDGLRKYLSCIKEDEEIIITEKLHGCYFAAVHDGERLWVKSRNYYKKFDPNDIWHDAAIRLDLKTKLQKYPRLAFFGELVGQVKGFRYDAKIENGKLLTTVHFFDIYDTVKSKYLDYDDRIAILKELGLSPVPELYRGKWLGKDKMYEYAEGMSTLNQSHVREGIVIIPVKERFEPKLNGRLQLKLIGKGYNLQK